MILLRTRLSTADYQHHSKHLLLQVLSLLYQIIQAKRTANPVAMHSWQLAVQRLCKRIAAVDAATASQSLGLRALPHPVTGGEAFLGIGIRPSGVGAQPTPHTAKRFIGTSLPCARFQLGTLMAIPMRIPLAAVIVLPGRHLGDECVTHVTLCARRPRLHQSDTTCVTVAVSCTVLIVLAPSPF
jgi:hypothetical protein